jgi:hypothetical protein
MFGKHIKSSIRYLLGKKAVQLISNENSILVNNVPLFAKTFGDLNSDKYFYVIRQPGSGRGLFSLFSSVLCHLDICDSLGFIPIIDFQNFPCVYNDPEVEGNKNVWEYYFEPVSEYTLDEVYSSKNVFFSIPDYPSGYSYSITAEPKLHKVLDKYIKFKPSILEKVKTFEQEFFLNRKLLGIHFRGQEMKTTPNHWYPPTKKQMTLAIDTLLEQYKFDALFVVTEEASYLEFLRSTYKNIDVLANNHYRTYSVNAYKQKPRKDHLFLLGKEVVIDALLLSHCHGIIYCTSNVATVSDFLNDSKYEAKIIINNGSNFSNATLAKYSWYIKSILPTSLGGFLTNFKINI